MTQSRLDSILVRCIQWRYLLLLVGLLLAAVGWTLSRDLAMDRSIVNMFAEDDPILEPYRQLQQHFGEHEIVLAVYSDPQLATANGVERLERLVDEIRTIPGITSAVSLLELPNAANFNDLTQGRRFREAFSGYTHNQAHDAAGIICLLPAASDSRYSRRQTLIKLRRLISKYPDGTLVGEPVLIEEAFDLLEEDGRRLDLWCTVLLMLTIYLCFRELRWLILPMVVVQFTLAMTRGTLVLLGLQLSLVSSMLAAIITVVSVATVMHVIVRYREATARGLAPREALLETGRLVAAPVFFACLTDAAGFAALMISDVVPVYEFGLMMAIGSLLVLVSVPLVTPSIVLLPLPSRESKATAEAPLNQSLARLLSIAGDHSKLIAGITLVATLLGIVGSTRLETETDFTSNFRDSSQLMQGYRFVEKNFGGAGVWDIIVPLPQDLQPQTAVQLLAFQQKLREEIPTLTKVLSLVDALDAGLGNLRNLGFGARIALRGGISMMRRQSPELLDAIYAPATENTSAYLRILLRSPEQLDAATKSETIEQVQQQVEEYLPEGSEVTGYYVLLNALIESLLRDQWTTFGVAVVAIGVMMGLAFRSATLAAMTLVPNALPVLFLFGAMGWLGIRVNMGAAMIAAVSVGLSVDGSIHYVMSYQRLRRAGTAWPDALASVQGTVGRAAVFATLALVVGFATLCYSDFIPTIYFGALVSLSMIGGLVGNLVVLPLLIGAIERYQNADDAGVAA